MYLLGGWDGTFGGWSRDAVADLVEADVDGLVSRQVEQHGSVRLHVAFALQLLPERVPHYPRSPTTIWPLLSTVSPERSSSSRSPTPICPDSGIPLQQTWNYTIPALFRNQSYVRHGIKLINLVYQRGPVAPDFPFKCWNVKFVFFDVELGTWINGNDCSVSCKNVHWNDPCAFQKQHDFLCSTWGLRGAPPDVTSQGNWR